MLSGWGGVITSLLKLENSVLEFIDVRAGELLDFLGTLHEHECRHGVDVVLCGNVLAFVDVDLKIY